MTTRWRPEVELEREILKEIGVEVVVLWRNERREGDFCKEGEEAIMAEEKMAFVEEEDAMAMRNVVVRGAWCGI